MKYESNTKAARKINRDHTQMNRRTTPTQHQDCAKKDTGAVFIPCGCDFSRFSASFSLDLHGGPRLKLTENLKTQTCQYKTKMTFDKRRTTSGSNPANVKAVIKQTQSNQKGTPRTCGHA
jgi:hypothetical protein